jgi:RimJ/RimL family protein N-acetyltransferase
LGYGFFPALWGRGLATEIATAFVSFAREQLRLPSVVAVTQHANLGSQRVLTKAGLAYERDFNHDGIPHMLYRRRL